MGITSQDIAAQRAMLDRGEQIIEAKKQHAETDRLRDTFAAAALTGLLAGPGDKDFSADYWARHAYEAADAMLRERGRTTNDASPEAGRPSMGAEDERVRASVQSTGNTQEPVAWAILHLDQQYVSLLREMTEAHNVFAAPLVPLYRSPTFTDMEREAMKVAIDVLGDCTYGNSDPLEAKAAATLRSLLERMK